MQLVEQHISRTDEWRDWCVKAKELYNQTLYYWRQSVFGNIQYFSEYEILGLFREFSEPTFKALPSHCGQEVLKNLFKNIKSWQASLKEYKKNPDKFLGRPRIPKYKKELSILSFNNGQIKCKNGLLRFPKIIGIAPIKTRIPDGAKVSGRVIPKSDHFVVEFCYEKKEKILKPDNGKYLGVDFGLNNLATCTSNTNVGFIINGRPIKSINQHYNKQKAKAQSFLLEKKYISKKINKLTFNRNNKIKNYLHHASRHIVNKADQNNIHTIVIGNNKKWKQEISLGKRTNQSFVSIPYQTLIEQVQYKAKLVGINTIVTEESYTSKCSALDFEPIQKHETYLGKRKKRGLFVTAGGELINADSNGSLNIIRKVFGDGVFAKFNKRCVVQPEKVKHFNEINNKIKHLYTK